ncbi:MAG: hypothetical protein RSA65_00745, partial [Clostridia bacterium]
KKLSLGLILAAMVGLLASTAMAEDIALNGYQLTTYHGVSLYDLIPNENRLGDGIKKVQSGYLRGGYERGDDVIGPMRENSTLAFFDDQLALQWEINDAKLEGGLFTTVKEGNNSLFLGSEYEIEQAWLPAILKINSVDGKIQWLFTGSPTAVISDFIPFEEGVITVGSQRKAEAGATFAVIARISSAGDIVWETSVEAARNLLAVYPYKDGIIALGQKQGSDDVNCYLFNAKGDLLHEQPLQSSPPVTPSITIETNDAGEIVAILQQPHTSEKDAMATVDYFVFPN